jgi:fructuronate reductase
MSTPRLNPAWLAEAGPAVQRSPFDRQVLAPGIVHLGIGAFMRAHLAVATEAAIARDGDLRWGIVGVSLRQADTRDALQPQSGLYTVAVRDADARGQPRQRLQVIGCVRELLVAPENPVAVLEAIARESTRIVSLTVTEKAYLREPASGALQWQHPDIAHDLSHPQTPRSALGFIVHGLALRRARGRDPITLMSLDNLPSNGHTLQRLVLALAERVDPALARWIDAGCSFPNSMVDRIVPRTTDADRTAVQAQLGAHDAWPVMAEPFFDWAVEDRFVAGRPDWDAGGARFVTEAAAWERLKLRMVNGAHSTIAYLGAVAGWATVDIAVSQASLRRAVEALMRDEIEPTLPPLPGLDLPRYRAELLKRFANPALAHRTQQIAMDGSQKLPQRLLGTVRDRLASGQSIAHLGLSIAAWLHYLRGHDEAGVAYPIEDPLAAPLAAALRAADALPTLRMQVEALTRFDPVFGDLGGVQALVDAITPAYASLRQHGVGATLAAAT